MSLYISTAPHVRSQQNTRSLMLDVIIALMPATIAGIYYFGVNAALLVVISTFSAVLFEYLWQKLTHKTIRVGDLSAAVTGLLVGLNLPPTAPWWLPVIGSGLAIILVKQLFGGIGDNFVNPALAARGISPPDKKPPLLGHRDSGRLERQRFPFQVASILGAGRCGRCYQRNGA